MPRDHRALLFKDCAALGRVLEEHVTKALDRGHAAVVIATQAHLDGLWTRLDTVGRDPAELRAAGQLVGIEARACLAGITNGREPDRQAFESALRPVIEQARRQFGGLSAYGELVDLLWQQSNHPAAQVLEQWWNELIDEYGFILLCGYHADAFDDRTQAGIQAICQTHSLLIPTADDSRFEEAVDAALQSVIRTPDMAALRQSLIDRCPAGAEMPPGQAALMGLHEILPVMAQQVRAMARAHYNRRRGA